MNITAMLGVLLLASVVVFASAASNISLASLWNLPGFIIVVVGTAAATLISFDFIEIRLAFRSLWVVFVRQRDQPQRDAQDIVAVTQAWRHGNLAAIQTSITTTQSPFLRLGLEMITDNIVPLPGIIETLRRRIDKVRAKEGAEAQVFKSMAGYAPAFGMLGTLFGLVQMLGNVAANNIPAIASGLAVALLTTMYGVILAYAFFRPFAAKIEQRTEARVKRMQIILEALCLMAQTRSPGVIKEFAHAVDLEFKDELGGGAAAPPRAAQ